ncbi:hypothetical protein [Shewanella psychrotolerans]|uniref:hypothetical protein n=1 Tax=Shewanella psychrotolerans TaxID=2864206 RepID=UPI001C654B89|nr:hypothetical protein [Shewanella psychrotolerans]QYK03139.1 hypothetical protein K0I62_09565 [Shewanella psychrotolerans]
MIAINTILKMNKGLTPNSSTRHFIALQVERYQEIAQWHLEHGKLNSAVEAFGVVCAYQRQAVKLGA